MINYKLSCNNIHNKKEQQVAKEGTHFFYHIGINIIQEEYNILYAKTSKKKKVEKYYFFHTFLVLKILMHQKVLKKMA